MASSEPLKNSNSKTWVLRVSIHCEGCKRKVKKILQTIPGVHDIEIETKQQRAVVTGDVAPETLIRKLAKSGKHAELWPEIALKPAGNFNPSASNNSKSERKPKTQEGSRQEPPVHEKEIKSPAKKTEGPVQDSSKDGETTVAGGGAPTESGGKVDEGAGKSVVAEKNTGGEKEAVEAKEEEKKPETGSAGNQASEPVVERKEEEIQKPGGESKKKKKKKSQNNNKNVIEETSSSASPPPPVKGGDGPPATTFPANQTPPPQQLYQYPPPHYYAPPPPAAQVYAVSYNTAHPPVNNYTASYYASPPPYSYAYSHPETENPQPQPRPPPPSDFDSYPGQPLDSFEMFSDENPNGCWVM